MKTDFHSQESRAPDQPAPRKDEFGNAPLREHSFDGIQEYDNDLPRWWVNLFFATIVFGVGYMVWYHNPFGQTETLESTYLKERARAAAGQQGNGPGAPGAPGGGAEASGGFDFVAAKADAALVAQGKTLFNQNCGSCHGALGQGLVGPNLTDDRWLHGSTYEAMEKIISNGVPPKGMPAWDGILGKSKIRSVAVYIGTLRGTNPAGAKAPEGEEGALP